MRFFLIDRITSWKIGESAEAMKNVTLSEDFFDDHFPRRPVMPGVLIIEGMAHISGLLLEARLKKEYGKSAKAILTILGKTKFRDMVKPGETLVYKTKMLSLNEVSGKVEVCAYRDKKPITSTEMIFFFKDVADSKLDEKRSALLNMWLGNE